MANKKLYRSDDRMLGGVMAGFAEYTDSDPTLWRLLGATIIVLSGIFPGLLLYIVAWLIMPDKSHGASSGKEVPSRSKLENMTKAEIKDYAESEYGIELSTNDLKDEMIDQFLREAK